ncbi:hypothetical protein BHF71_07425 [Vulcanibacillus modesticaldus]|uniref:CBS domain-containing protein n=1 Tax=Vulcanibacillus modesticaldus TaxID=337097 RepID=A0A1D2YW25_9BACI|nr:CBS domain-containing protein [Vulcanibacillus modesticaldus]OEF99930.1 hypothetical protein BHF71_07425 [Vulcanibacillus modesticaldus]
MFIHNCITYARNLVTLKKDDTIGHAISVMKKNQLKSIPVIDDDGKFVGILSKEGLFEIFEKGQIGDYEDLKREPIAMGISKIEPLNLDSRFEQLLPIIVRYPFVPIIDDEGIFQGIVKRKEITRALESSFGVGVSGIRILIGTLEMEGRLEKILEIVHHLHLNVITALAFDAGEKFNRRVLLKIEHTDKKEELLNILEKNGFKILTIHED